MTEPAWAAPPPVVLEGVWAAAEDLTPAMFAPVAIVAVDGVDVASGAASALEDGLMVVDGVTVTWGRDEVLAQPTPATGRLVLFDPTRTWATRADRRGLAVTVRYEGLANAIGQVEDRRNLVPNPRLGVDLTSWTANYGTGGAGTLTRLSTGGPAGGPHARATWTTATTAAGSGQLRADGRAAQPLPIPVTPGQIVSAAVYARSSIAQRMLCQITYFDATGGQAGISPTGHGGTQTVLAANTWTRLTCENRTVPAGAAYCLIGPQAVSGTGAVVWPVGSTLDATQAQLELAATVGGYFDGATPAAGSLTYAWTGTADASQSIESAPGVVQVTQSAVYFRGRIGSPVNVSRRRVRHPVTGETILGALVELPLQSLLVDLANYVPRFTWPAETMGARMDRVVSNAQSVGLLAGGGDIRSFWRVPDTVPVAVADQVSLFDHLEDLFASSGADNYTYHPATDEVRYVPRHNYTNRSMGRLWWDGTDPLLPRAGQGAYIKAVDALFPADTETGLGLYLDAASLEYDPADGVTTPARITRAAVSHPDQTAGYATRDIEKTVQLEPWDPAGGSRPVDERVSGVRTASVDSVCANPNYADTALSDTEELVRREGSRWVLDPLRLSTRRTGGFETVIQAQLLLAGWERNFIVFLQRSWLPELGLRPVFGVMGATIAYAREGWDVEFALAPITTTAPQHSLTAEELNSADPAYQLEAWDAPHPKGMHPSVTWEDLRFVGAPLTGPFPPESDKDEQQT